MHLYARGQVCVRLLLSHCAIQLEDRQLREIISVAMNMANFAKLERFSEFRPAETIFNDPAAWWRCVCA